MSKFFKDAESKNIFYSFVSLDAIPDAPVLKELNTNHTDGAFEKHVPVIEINGNQVHVSVGSVAHPMLEEHYITAIYLETKRGGQIRHLQPGEAPEATFLLAEGDEVVAASEYCNLHGLWSTK